MASSFTLDISGLTQQVVAAITAGFVKIQQDVKAAAGNAKGKENLEERDLEGMRQLILSNARILYRMHFGIDASIPEMDVAILGCGTIISAAVVSPIKVLIQGGSSAGKNRELPRYTTWFESDDTDSVSKAMGKLLTLTSKLVLQDSSWYMVRANGCEEVNTQDGRYWLPPTKIG